MISAAAGLRTSAGRSRSELTVLCVHTHSSRVAEILPNLEVRMGRAEYGVLQVQPGVPVV